MKAASAWAHYFDECWTTLYPDLPLPYGDTSELTIMRMYIVRQYAEDNAPVSIRIRRALRRWWP